MWRLTWKCMVIDILFFETQQDTRRYTGVILHSVHAEIADAA
jgi:hypothetical protein